MQAWLVAYLVTCTVEIPVVVTLLRYMAWRPVGRYPLAQCVAVAWSLQLTHPIFWWIDPSFPSGVLVAEVVIVLVEAAGLCLWAVFRCGVRCGTEAATLAGLVSFAANGASFALGLLASVALGGY